MGPAKRPNPPHHPQTAPQPGDRRHRADRQRPRAARRRPGADRLHRRPRLTGRGAAAAPRRLGGHRPPPQPAAGRARRDRLTTHLQRTTTLPDVSTVTLNNGVTMPDLGLGVFQTPPDETRDAVTAALEAGYRHIDTAAAYGNERQVGEAIAASDVDRNDVFVETKIWISDYGYDQTLHGFEKSARKLGVDQIDLLILHQALPSAFEKTLEAYRALETLLADGRVRAIGVSNFMVDHLTSLLEKASVVPAVNQIEQHPYFAQADVQAFGTEHGILAQAWSPIGGITFYRDSEHTSTLKDPVIVHIADAHGKTPAQVML